MSPVGARTEVLADPPALAERVAEWMTATATTAEGEFRVALSGGSTPKALYALLASDKFRSRFPWPRVHWFWGDERFVPHDHPESNYRMVRDAMLLRAPVPPDNIHPIPTEGDPEDAARRYQQTLKRAYGSPTLDPARPLFDIILLGLGEDGHTASLLPEDKLLDERERWVAAVLHGRPEVRITLTFPVLESGRHVAFLVAGEGKAAALRRVRAGDRRLPAARIHPAGEVIWFVDRAAATNAEARQASSAMES
jgi:6-phosphogluconolactonase